jgi:host factor-I protein
MSGLAQPSSAVAERSLSPKPNSPGPESFGCLSGKICRLVGSKCDTISFTPLNGRNQRRESREAKKPKKGQGNKMSEKSQNVQDVFLNHIRKNKTPVTIFLVNGVKLQGIVTWFDNFSVLLRRDAHSQLVYKHAISTVMPAHPIQLFEPQKEDA